MDFSTHNLLEAFRIRQAISIYKSILVIYMFGNALPSIPWVEFLPHKANFSHIAEINLVSIELGMKATTISIGKSEG